MFFAMCFHVSCFTPRATSREAYYSTTVTRWFTALTAQQRVFKLPFQAVMSLGMRIWGISETNLGDDRVSNTAKKKKNPLVN